MGFALIYDSFSDTALFSGGDWDIPLTNLRLDDVGLVAQSSSLDPGDTRFRVDLGKARPVGGIVVGPCNSGPGATVEIEAFADAAMTVRVYTTGAIGVMADSVNWANPADWLAWEDPNFWIGLKSDEPEVEALPLYFSHIVPPEQVGAALARYWRVSIDDPANASGRVRIGRVIIGRAYRPSLNYTYSGNETGFTWATDRRESLGGRRTFSPRFMRRKLRVAFDYLPEIEAFGDWFRLGIATGVHRQVFVVPEETDAGALLRKRAFLATLNEAPAIQQVVFERAAMALQAEEVI